MRVQPMTRAQRLRALFLRSHEMTCAVANPDAPIATWLHRVRREARIAKAYNTHIGRAGSEAPVRGLHAAGSDPRPASPAVTTSEAR